MLTLLTAPYEAMRSPCCALAMPEASQVVVCGLGVNWVPNPIPSLTVSTLL